MTDQGPYRTSGGGDGTTIEDLERTVISAVFNKAIDLHELSKLRVEWHEETLHEGTGHEEKKLWCRVIDPKTRVLVWGFSSEMSHEEAAEATLENIRETTTAELYQRGLNRLWCVRTFSGMSRAAQNELDKLTEEGYRVVRFFQSGNQIQVIAIAAGMEYQTLAKGAAP